LKNKFNTIIAIIRNSLTKFNLTYVVENADWVIRNVGLNITKNLNNLNCQIVTTPLGIKNSTIHFGSINTFLNETGIVKFHKSNKTIVSLFHLTPGDQRTQLIPIADKQVTLWHTASEYGRSILTENGIKNEKIEVVPLGVNTKKFYRPSIIEKEKIRCHLKIPKTKIVIGSFQKDGEGWGEGNKPKLIKGPDILCDVIESLSKKFDVFVLLTGPSRGYVKNRLTKASIPFLHHYLKNPNDVAKYYMASDLYIVSSRVEGGPQAILESLATGVPLVSTRVGLAPDIIINRTNGLLCEADNIESIYNSCYDLLGNKIDKEQMILNGLESIKNYDWQFITKRYYKQIYYKLL